MDVSMRLDLIIDNDNFPSMPLFQLSILQAPKKASKQGNNKEQEHTRNKGTNERNKKELKRNSNLLKQVLTPEDGQITPKHVVILKF
jgi:hypothetical protein